MTLGNKAETPNDVSATLNGTASRRPKCNYVPPSCGVTRCAVVLICIRCGPGQERILDIVPGGTELGTQVKTGSRAGRTHTLSIIPK